MAPNLHWVRGRFGLGRVAGRLVVTGGVELEFAEGFAGGGVDDADFRSWMSIGTEVRAWVRPMPMWWSLPATRRMSLPSESTRSLRHAEAGRHVTRNVAAGTGPQSPPDVRAAVRKITAACAVVVWRALGLSCTVMAAAVLSVPLGRLWGDTG
jgi:hypothetical protein